jgi:hypothetical protein
MRRNVLGAFASTIAVLSGTAIGASTDPVAEYAIVERIPGPSSVAGWDYATIDSRARRLFLATSYRSVGGVSVLDLSSGRVTPSLLVDTTPHGIAVLGNGTAAAADASKNAVLFFDEQTGRIVASVDTGKPPQPDGWHNPDSLLLEPKSELLIAVNGDSGALSLVDVTRHSVVDSIVVGGKLEAAGAAGDGTVYVNVETSGTIAVVDVPARKVIRKLPLKGCEEPTGLEYDAADRMIISVCSNGLAKFVDPDSGSELASIHVGRGADAVMYDAARKVVFIAGGDEGELSIIRVANRRHISIVQTLATQPGTRLGAVDILTGKFYLQTTDPYRLARIRESPVPVLHAGS